ncbi:MAG: carbohydrate kinase family protein, partial [Rhodanobacteraceae bacterium]
MSAVCCFGEALIDFHGSTAGSAPAFIAHPGGAPANVAVAVARLGGHAVFVGMFGADAFGDLLLRELAAAGVDTTHARRTDAANTALAFVSHSTDGERDFTFYRPPSADLLFRSVDFDAAIFSASEIFHAGSCSMTEPGSATATLQGMAHARDAGALVSFDMNLRPPLWPRGEDPAPTIWHALELADFVKLSAEELAFLASSTGGENAAFARLWQAHVKLMVVTDGDRAVRWFTPYATGERQAFPVRAVETTGAGDAVVG